MIWLRNGIIAAVVALSTSAIAQVASVVELEIVPERLEVFLAALKTNGALTIKEPGCRRYDILQSPSNPNQVLIFEVYDNQAAVDAHRATEHFKNYVTLTKDMVSKRQSRPMTFSASYAK